ncbi:short chain type dehydrogenase [Rickenella mellea]|uniref:Short chain type dehydrogenase n=1 Tax=Rickenella mellea TaxID=50990 RepID=A0A4Y7QA89_9AGAM|nr:short chain type dehydrogenase [Rickenella mellea]
MKIQDRTFIVSGGSSGLGLATAQNLHDAGAYIYILDLNENPTIQSQLRPRGKFQKVDITNVKEIEAAVDAAVAWTHETNAPLGGVVNCAGVGTASKIIDAHGSPHSLDLWDFTIAVNLTGTFNLTRLVCQHLVKNEPEGPDKERGIVILVSSAAAFEGQPGQTAYSATKGALHSMTLPLARDLGRYGVRVNTVAPGIFASTMTERLPPKAKASLERELVFPTRFGQANEFAQTVRWLVECVYMNGETVRLSAGSRLPGRL